MDSRAAGQRERDERSVEELAAEAAAGSSACFEALVQRLGPRLLRYLRQRVCDDHAAEDLLQETFLKAYRGLGRYDPSRSFATWLFTIGTRLAASYWRSRRPTVPMEKVDPPDGGDCGPLEAAARAEQRQDLWALARRALPEGQFTALWLRYAEDMAVRQIAEVTGRSVGAVKVMLHRACRRLMARRGFGQWVPARVPAPGKASGQGVVETR